MHSHEARRVTTPSKPAARAKEIRATSQGPTAAFSE